MNSKKGLKYYGYVFLFSILALTVYVAYLSIKDGEIDYTLISSLIIVPFIFTIFLFLFDKIFDKIFPSKATKLDEHLKTYLDQIGVAITDNCNFSIEDYRRLKISPSFQKSLEQAYKILTNGETKEINFQFLEKKFKKNTNENTAILVVIDEVKKMMENS